MYELPNRDFGWNSFQGYLLALREVVVGEGYGHGLVLPLLIYWLSQLVVPPFPARSSFRQARLHQPPLYR